MCLLAHEPASTGVSHCKLLILFLIQIFFGGLSDILVILGRHKLTCACLLMMRVSHYWVEVMLILFLLVLCIFLIHINYVWHIVLQSPFSLITFMSLSLSLSAWGGAFPCRSEKVEVRYNLSSLWVLGIEAPRLPGPVKHCCPLICFTSTIFYF